MVNLSNDQVLKIKIKNNTAKWSSHQLIKYTNSTNYSSTLQLVFWRCYFYGKNDMKSNISGMYLLG
jgi:hypothetical protein